MSSPISIASALVDPWSYDILVTLGSYYYLGGLDVVDSIEHRMEIMREL